jgi:hypothetical protein
LHGISAATSFIFFSSSVGRAVMRARIGGLDEFRP